MTGHDKMVVLMRYLGLAVLILSILGSQVGIAVIVAEWRGGTETIIERSATVPSGPSQAELDVRKCEAALEAAGSALTRETTGTTGLRTINENTIVFGPSVPGNINLLIERYC